MHIPDFPAGRQRVARRQFLAGAAAGLATTACLGSTTWAADQPAAASAESQVRVREADGVAWRTVSEWGVEGRGWDDTARYYDRFPARAEALLRPAVWSLSRHSAGMLFRFATDATDIHYQYRLMSNRLEMNHMPATGVSGLDLYAQDATGADRWLAVSRPASQEMRGSFGAGIDPPEPGQLRRYTIYLPLYNGVDALEIGVASGARFQPLVPRREKPIVFYGTSIMHGACASRPGMSISGILGRRLDRPVINLGFSGNGRMEPAVGQLLGELDAAVYAIDCLPNMQGGEVAERAAPLVRQLKQARPDTPIVLVEDRTYTNARFRASMRRRHTESRAALRAAYEQLLKEGVRQLFYLPGDGLLGDDGEAATDGSHPNDLGMVRYADAYEPVLRQALNPSR